MSAPNDTDDPALVPPIFKWAESLSSNLERLQQQLDTDTTKLQEFHSKFNSNHQSEKCLPITSPKSARTLKSAKSQRSTHLSPLTIKSHHASSSTLQSPKSVAPDMAKHTIISFEPDTNSAEPRNIGTTTTAATTKSFADLPQTLHTTATRVTSDGERIIADVAKKIWGKNVPKTFLTALDMELPTTESEDLGGDETNAYSSSVYSTYRTARSPPQSKPRRSVILPALQVTKETIPPELQKQNLGFPNKTDPDTLLPAIIESMEFESNREHEIFTNSVTSNSSLDIISDGFWWFLIDEWKKNEMERHKETQQAVFRRMSKNYVKMFLASPQDRKDMIFNNYYDVLSQSIFTCFVQQYPKSKHLFTNEIKIKILSVTAKWTMGCVPNKLSVDHWYITMSRRRQGIFLQKMSLDEIASQGPNYVIPLHISRKEVVFKHSEFVQYYLKYEAKYVVADKTEVKMTMTCNKPTTEDQLPFHTLREESMKCQEESEEVRNKLSNAQKELNKLIRSDKNALKEYQTELKQEELRQMKSKKQFVKDILKQLIPNEYLPENQD